MKPFHQTHSEMKHYPQYVLHTKTAYLWNQLSDQLTTILVLYSTAQDNGLLCHFCVFTAAVSTTSPGHRHFAKSASSKHSSAISRSLNYFFLLLREFKLSYSLQNFTDLFIVNDGVSFLLPRGEFMVAGSYYLSVSSSRSIISDSRQIHRLGHDIFNGILLWS